MAFYFSQIALLLHLTIRLFELFDYLMISFRTDVA